MDLASDSAAEPWESLLSGMESLPALDLLAGGLLVGVQATLGREAGGSSQFSFPLDRGARAAGSGVSLFARAPVGF